MRVLCACVEPAGVGFKPPIHTDLQHEDDEEALWYAQIYTDAGVHLSETHVAQLCLLGRLSTAFTL